MTIEAPQDQMDTQPTTTREQFLSSSAKNCYYSASNSQYFFNLRHRAPSKVGNFSLLFNDPRSHIGPPPDLGLIVAISGVAEATQKVAVIAKNGRQMQCTPYPEDVLLDGFERDIDVEQKVCELINCTPMVVP